MSDPLTIGFILTRQRREIAGRLYLEYWLVTDSGPVKLLTSPQQEVFFVRQCDEQKISQVLLVHKIHYEIKSLELKNFQQEGISALYFDKSIPVYKARQQLQAEGIVCYENEIRLTDRFLMERFVYGNACFTGATVATALDEPYSTFHHAQLKPVEQNAKNDSPEFKVLSIDIECSEKGELYSIGLAADNYQCVLMIGESQEDAPEWIVWMDNEKSLLQSFIQQVARYDPDIFIGWNVVNFDFRLLLKRAKHHNITLTLGRGNEVISWRDARGEVNQGYVSMPGRVVVDGIDGLKTATYHFESFSLEFVAQSLLGKGKKTEDVDNRMAAINHDFKYNKVKLAEYNLQDCILVLDIFSHTQLLQFLTLRSQLTGLELDRMGGSVAAFVNLYLPKLHRAGYISPNRPDDGGLASPGGYVMDSQPGLYRHVLVLDFKSLYPAIIRTFKIDPLGLIEGLLFEGEDTSEESPIPGYRGGVFSRDKHFLPDIITSLWRQRDQAKKSNDGARSQAIKILMNSFYGVLGSGGCPFYDTRLASSITMRGHDIMQTTAAWIKEAGYKVIYGDTDSTFIWLDGDYSNEQAQIVGKKLQKSINSQWTAYVRDNYQLESYLEIEFETHFTQFLMPTIRGSKQGSKKRYAGIKNNNNGGELIFKGLETVRSDWTPLAKLFQTKLYGMVFSEQDVRNYLQQIIIDIRRGKYDEQLVYRKRLRRRLELYVKNVPPHVKAARQADAANKAQGKTLRYQNKGWISYIVTVNGPEAVEHRSAFIDYDHYIKKQVQPIAEGILPFIGLSFEEITSAQLNLF